MGFQVVTDEMGGCQAVSLACKIYVMTSICCEENLLSPVYYVGIVSLPCRQLSAMMACNPHLHVPPSETLYQLQTTVQPSCRHVKGNAVL